MSTVDSDRPEIVCICGSMRFSDEILAANRRLTLAGAIVVAPAVLTSGEPPESIPSEQQASLAALHLRKIDLADRVLVVNPCGYVGKSTSREIAYARAAGKPVSFTVPATVPDVQKSPRISEFSWGRVDVEGLASFKDLKLWPGGGRAWDWNETGTRHRPGIQLADARELLDHGAEVVVLSRGVDEVLQVPTDLVTELEARGIEVVVAASREAVDHYNELVDTRAVGSLLHSTC